MPNFKHIQENGMHLLFEVSEQQDVRLLHFSSERPTGIDTWREKKRRKFRLIEVHFSGENKADLHDMKYTGTLPGNRLKLLEWKDSKNKTGRKLTITQWDEKTEAEITCHFQFYDNISIVKSWSVVENKGEAPIGLEYVSSFALTGIDKEGDAGRDDKLRLHIPHNTWFGEAQWKAYRVNDLGLQHVNQFSVKRLSFQSLGSWSTSQYAPLGILVNEEIGNSLFWQIEHNGSWHWEISDKENLLYLQLSGPAEQEHHWWKELQQGEVFQTVEVAVGSTKGSFNESMEQLTKYRRQIRRKNADNEKLPVIFNDYMNCLFGDPTTEKEIPLIDAASEAGCEYYCIDCGWYADGEWWDSVGEWLPSAKRFPGGIEEVLQYIRDKGMVPGLWLELEVMGVKCELADQVPNNWFFCRHGKRVVDNFRYQLDFRNPEVRAYATKVMKRVVEDYGAGYIKMDYNLNAGIGTDLHADSAGDGLLEHNRAYLTWLDSIFAAYPELIIENCGSGGMRIDYALLSRHSIQSTSDQTDYLKNAVIAAASSSLLTPEQGAVWSYPLKDGNKEEVIINMMNSMLLRIHQSGNLAELSSERFQLVQEGIRYYKKIRSDIAKGIPFWPLGAPGMEDDWISFGIRSEDRQRLYIAVWRLKGKSETCQLPLPILKGQELHVHVGYPVFSGEVEWQWNTGNHTLSVSLPVNPSARLFEIQLIK